LDALDVGAHRTELLLTLFQSFELEAECQVFSLNLRGDSLELITSSDTVDVFDAEFQGGRLGVWLESSEQKNVLGFSGADETRC